MNEGGYSLIVAVLMSEDLKIHQIGNRTSAANTRTNLTLTISRDDGVTWDEEITVHAGKSGYSDLVKISENLVGIFYEGGIKRYTDGLDFKIIDIHSKSIME